MQRKVKLGQHVLMILLLGLWAIHPVYAVGDEISDIRHQTQDMRLEASQSHVSSLKSDKRKSARPSWESQRYLIEGVHYLINEGDRDTAEGLFRKAILASSFGSLSREAEEQDRRVVADSFYFLGRIYYEKAILDTGYSILDTRKERRASNIQNVGCAKKYLKKAEEYGIVYDRLHPPLLDEINRKYPGIEVIPAYAGSSEPNSDKAKVIIEIAGGSYQIDAVGVNQHADVTESEFMTNEEFGLECGARYKVKPDIQGGHKSVYKVLTALGIGLVVWLTRG